MADRKLSEAPARMITYPVPMRTDWIAEVRLPTDVSHAEIDKLCKVMHTVVLADE